MDLARIQEALRRQNLDGWLFFDHHLRDPLAYRILGLTNTHVTRRWYYLIPAEGEPSGMVHRIESGMLNTLPGEKHKYSSWQEQQTLIARLLDGKKRIAMQYSPRCAVPYVAMVDAGTIELIRDTGAEVVSSAELIAEFEACLSRDQFQSHLDAGVIVDGVRESAFRLISEKLDTGIDEITIRDFIVDQFHSNGLITDHSPIVGVNAHAGDPHYEPRPETNSPVHPGDVVLLDMWAKFDRPGAIYYDITWMGVCGPPSSKVQEVFEIVTGARDAAIQTVTTAVAQGRELRGFEVDDATRAHIRERGYGEWFVHRTGHSIGEEVHGTGANMDNLETHDDRRILPGSLFSIEPGIYLPEFGVRSEVNMFVGADSAQVTGAIQRDLIRIR